MAEYTGLQSILNAALGPYQAKDFRLVEQDDHISILFYRDEKVAVFSQQGMTIQSLHQACAQWLEKREAAHV